MVQASWIKISTPILNEAFVLLQEIDLEKEHPTYNLMMNLNFGLNMTALFLLVYVFSSFFIFFLKWTKKRLANRALPKFGLRKIASSCLNITDQVHNISPSMSVFILMLELFLWLIMLMVVNTTKTNKVVIDTSDILRDLDDALSTPKTFCLMDDDTEYKVFYSTKKNATQ